MKVGGEPPSFSYHTMLVSKKNDADRTSVSPSPSKSVAKTERVPSAAVETTRSVKLGGEPPSLSYHAILLPPSEAESTSVSPSPSTSVAKTDQAPKAVVEITRSVKGTSTPRAGSTPDRLAAIPASGLKTASGFNTAANDAPVILLCLAT